MKKKPNPNDDILVIIKFSQDEHYTEYLLVQLINIYYTRKQQGLSIDSFIYALHATESKELQDETVTSFLSYLQGVIRCVLARDQNINNKYV